MIPKLSVIVPVYNGEKYLHECIDSILLQELKEIEILLIDDGSTDSSGVICDKYESLYEQVKVLHIQNGGVSRARNLGIEKAQGLYIMFLDCDDYLDSCFSEGKVSDYLQNDKESFLHFGMTRDYFSEGVLVRTVNPSNNLFADISASSRNICPKDDFKIMFENDILDSACGKLFNRKLIERENIRFIEGMSVREDTCFVMDYISCAEEVVILNSNYYHYRIQGNEQYSLRRFVPFQDVLILTTKIAKCIENYNIDNAFSARMSYFIYQTFLNGIIHLASGRFRNKKYSLYTYVKSLINNDVIFQMIMRINIKECRGFHRLFLFMFLNKRILILTIFCKLRFWNI